MTFHYLKEKKKIRNSCIILPVVCDWNACFQRQLESTKRYLNRRLHSAKRLEISFTSKELASVDPLYPTCTVWLSQPLRDPAGIAAAHKEEDPPSVLSIRSCISSVGCTMLFANKSLFNLHLVFAKGGVAVGDAVQFVQFNATRMPVLINSRLPFTPSRRAGLFLSRR